MLLTKLLFKKLSIEVATFKSLNLPQICSCVHVYKSTYLNCTQSGHFLEKKTLFYEELTAAQQLI